MSHERGGVRDFHIDVLLCFIIIVDWGKREGSGEERQRGKLTSPRNLKSRAPSDMPSRM